MSQYAPTFPITWDTARCQHGNEHREDESSADCVPCAQRRFTYVVLAYRQEAQQRQEAANKKQTPHIQSGLFEHEVAECTAWATDPQKSETHLPQHHQRVFPETPGFRYWVKVHLDLDPDTNLPWRLRWTKKPVKKGKGGENKRRRRKEQEEGEENEENGDKKDSGPFRLVPIEHLGPYLMEAHYRRTNCGGRDATTNALKAMKIHPPAKKIVQEWINSCRKCCHAKGKKANPTPEAFAQQPPVPAPAAPLVVPQAPLPPPIAPLPAPAPAPAPFHREFPQPQGFPPAPEPNAFRGDLQDPQGVPFDFAPADPAFTDLQDWNVEDFLGWNWAEDREQQFAGHNAGEAAAAFPAAFQADFQNEQGYGIQQQVDVQQPAEPGFNNPMPAFDDQTQQFNNQPLQFDNGAPQFHHQAPQFHHPAPEFNLQAPQFNPYELPPRHPMVGFHNDMQMQPVDPAWL